MNTLRLVIEIHLWFFLILLLDVFFHYMNFSGHRWVRLCSSVEPTTGERRCMRLVDNRTLWDENAFATTIEGCWIHLKTSHFHQKKLLSLVYEVRLSSFHFESPIRVALFKMRRHFPVFRTLWRSSLWRLLHSYRSQSEHERPSWDIWGSCTHCQKKT